MAELLIKQVRSTNGTSPKQRETLRSLCLGRIGRSARQADSAELRGMLRVVGHLVEIDENAAGTKQPAEASSR